jgi:nitrogen regulatory protein P-II 1
LVCFDDEAEAAISTIINSANTDSTGDEKIFISHVDEIIRVHTEEIGVSTL